MKHVGFIFLVSASLSLSPVGAQETTEAILGSVIAPDGAPLPGIQLTVDYPEIGLSRSVLNRTDGVDQIPALAPARYQVTASFEGFQTFRRTH